MKSTRICLGLSALVLIGAAEPSSAELPAWMAGCWTQTTGDRWTEECWTSPRAGIMLGSGRSGRGEVLDTWETMQMVVDVQKSDGGRTPVGFFAAPYGGDRVLFAWRPGADGGDAVTFENPDHDYPQRIRYWRMGDRLEAEISRLDGSRIYRWSLRRAGSL